MVSITLSVPMDIKQEMDKFPEMNWSAIAREAIQKRILMLHRFQEFTRESTLTEDDALKLGRDLKRRVWERHQKRK